MFLATWKILESEKFNKISWPKDQFFENKVLTNAY